MALHVFSTDQIAGGVLLLTGAGTVAAGARLMLRSVRLGRSLAVVRGIRVLILGIVAWLAALGLLSARPGFLGIGALILAEELYETGVLAVIIRRGDAGSAAAGEER
jgi:hypothetical protein